MEKKETKNRYGLAIDSYLVLFFHERYVGGLTGAAIFSSAGTIRVSAATTGNDDVTSAHTPSPPPLPHCIHYSTTHTRTHTHTPLTPTVVRTQIRAATVVLSRLARFIRSHFVYNTVRPSRNIHKYILIYIYIYSSASHPCVSNPAVINRGVLSTKHRVVVVSSTTGPSRFALFSGPFVDRSVTSSSRVSYSPTAPPSCRKGKKTCTRRNSPNKQNDTTVSEISVAVVVNTRLIFSLNDTYILSVVFRSHVNKLVL